jgi:hypothetical protein
MKPEGEKVVDRQRSFQQLFPRIASRPTVQLEQQEPHTYPIGRCREECAADFGFRLE